MHRLTILFVLSISILSLSAQEVPAAGEDGIELTRDIEYFRNTRADFPLPDVFMSISFPPLPSRKENRPLKPLILSEFRLEGLPEGLPEDTPRQKFLPPPVPVPDLVIPAGYQRNTELTLKASIQNGSDFNLKHAFPSSSLFLAGGSPPEGPYPQWLLGGVSSSGPLSFSAMGGGHLEDDERFYALAGLKAEPGTSALRFPGGLSFFYQDRGGDGAVFPEFNTGMTLSGSSWITAMNIETDALIDFSESSDALWRLRPALTVGGSGAGPGGSEWRGDLGGALELRTGDEGVTFFPIGELTLVTPRGISFFLTVRRSDLDSETRMRFVLPEESGAGILGLTGWLDGAAGMAGQGGGVDFYMKGGVRSGDFLYEESGGYAVIEGTFPYGDLQFLYKKAGRPVTDLSFHAEYFNSEELQFRMKNTWYLPGWPWETGLRAGHYHPLDERFSTLVRNENLLYGLFTVFRGWKAGEIKLFFDYLPEDEMLNGGVSISLSF